MSRVTVLLVSVCALVCASSKPDSAMVKREDNQSNASSTRRQASSGNPSHLYYYYYPVQEKKRQSTGDYDSSYNPSSTSYEPNLGENLAANPVYQGAASNQNVALYGGQTAGFGGVNGFTGSNFGGVGAASDISQINAGGYGGLGQLAAATGGYGINGVPAQTAPGTYGLGTPGGISQLTAAGYGGGGLGVAGGSGLNQFVPGVYGTANGYGQFGVPGGFGGYGQGSYGGHGDLRPSASSAVASYGVEPQSALGWRSLIMPILALAGLGLLLPSVSSLTSSSRRKRETQEKTDVFSEYLNKLEKYYAIYRSAVENEQCLNRVICELGNGMSNDKIEIISILEKFMPEKISNKMKLLWLVLHQQKPTSVTSTNVNTLGLKSHLRLVKHED
ncbi:uncharacterized protein LOC143239117 [Tachypleus tridentatus]|uniref:uncharacterized protein LOC143239117 n=1 Tax=Tachypleus tridentatus TaxID=6853 RepID=UPI003FD31C2E